MKLQASDLPVINSVLTHKSSLLQQQQLLKVAAVIVRLCVNGYHKLWQTFYYLPSSYLHKVNVSNNYESCWHYNIMSQMLNMS